MLPLLERTTESAFPLLLTTEPATTAGATCALPSVLEPRIPDRLPGPGEQYRFHFDMTQCIGCKCCVVACNEQNGNPAAINWRRVGEIEGGFYPNTSRFYLSMGCNHCVEPSCLNGCPVDAYSKDPVTGTVRHNANACIGCQYCTWNCSYGVPQYNPERGVVGKCDMCYDRLADGREPACVNACPEGAIRIEIVNTEEWKQTFSAMANAPGLPSAADSISTTRITVPEDIPHDLKKANFWRVKPEEPHWPLVAMTVLTQLSVGAFATIWISQLFGTIARLNVAAVGSLLVGGAALSASTLHLGRPIHAYRALRMWKRSWLSREVLMFTLFSVFSGLYAGSLLLKLPRSFLLGAFAAIFGFGGIAASSCIYMVRARPAWNNKSTIAEFFLTSFVLGPLFAASLGMQGHWLTIAPVVASSAALLNLAAKFLRMSASEEFELKASALLLSTVLAGRFLFRGALLILGGIVLPLFAPTQLGLALALVVSIFGEILGRYLFFIGVVPKNMAGSYLGSRKEAA